MLVPPITVLARQKLKVDLQLCIAISLRWSESLQGVGGDGVEGGAQRHLRGGAGGQQNSTLTNNRHVKVVGQGDLEAFF